MSAQMAENASNAERLRKHNFKFGFQEEGQFDSFAQLNKTAAAKKSLYEYTKATSENNNEWRQQQLNRNRNSNIQWGLKREDATPDERFVGRSILPNA